jgi:hypothetical protein
LISTTGAVEISGDRERVRKRGRPARYDHARRNKRGSTWTWHVDVGVDPVTGRRRQQTKGGFKTKRECQAALNDALAALRAGTFVEPSKRTLERFLVDEWLPALRHLRPSTLSNYRTHIRTCVLPALGPIPLQQLSPAHLNAFYQALLTRGRLRDGHGMAPRPSRTCTPSSTAP